MTHRSPQMVLTLLASKPVVTLKQIQKALDHASRATAFRYLQQIPYRRSYNHNGRYYTRYNPDVYDRFGLWTYDDVFFSRDGSLKKSIRRLVHEAEAGVTHRELRKLLRVPVQFTLAEAVRETTIDRERIEGLYVYVHTVTAIKATQLERRREQISAANRPDVAVNDVLVIEVLLVLIHYPGSQPGDVVRHLRGYSPPISRAQVDAVFTQYQLAEKKTTSSTS